MEFWPARVSLWSLPAHPPTAQASASRKALAATTHVELDVAQENHLPITGEECTARLAVLAIFDECDKAEDVIVSGFLFLLTPPFATACRRVF